MKEAFIATAYTNRGGCVRRKALEHCGHKHRSYSSAVSCAERRQRSERRPRFWRVDHVVWIPTRAARS